MAGPTDLEQLLLELINDARLSPLADAGRYVKTDSELPVNCSKSACKVSLRRSYCSRLASATCYLAVLAAAPHALAEPLHQAMAAAYEFNSRLLAERASLRALDEEVARANSGYRPTLSANADAGSQRETDRPRDFRTSGITQPRGFGITATQQLFNGFRTINGVREAEAGVMAGRANLLAVEQAVLGEVANAYMSVIRDQKLVALRETNVDFLQQELAANVRRREEGHVTRTDVSQTAAQLSVFKSQLQLANGHLQASLAAYERVVGRPPSNSRLMEPRIASSMLPSNLEQAMAQAEQDHPNVIAATFREHAAKIAIDRIRGELLPSAQLQSVYTRRLEPSVLMDKADTLSVRGVVSIPIYSGGEVEARVRQAKQTHIARIEELNQARRDARARASQAWTALDIARRRLASDRQNIVESSDALDGMRKEERAGQRTVNEVLNAQQIQFNAQANLLATEYDLKVATYTLLASIGRLHTEYLDLSADVYDPRLNYEATKRRWSGLTITHSDGRKEAVPPK